MTALLPIVWVAFEYTRSWLWSVVDATGYPYGQLGLTQVNRTWLVQIADVGGVYAVTALIAAVNGLATDAITWLQQRRQGIDWPAPSYSAISSTLVLASTLAYGAWRTQQETLRIGPAVCLMPRLDFDNNTSGAKATNQLQELATNSTLRDLSSMQAGDSKPEMLIWSEGAYPGKVQLDSGSSTAIALASHLTQFAQEFDATLVFGCDRLESPVACYNSAAVIDPQAGYLGSYDKLRLVPFNEFYPARRPRFGPERRNDFVHGQQYPIYSIIAGQPRQEYSFAIAICYDTGFPEVFRRYIARNAAAPDFFVIPAFERHDRQMRLQWKLLALAQFRAIETRRAFVRNAESGYSGVIDGNGLLISAPESVEFQNPVFLGRMPIDQRTSLYAYLGDWLPIGACGLIVASLGLQIFGKRAARRIGKGVNQNGNSNAI